ncbi:MAG: lipocalin family protein [Bacteroidia bacterium]
MKLVHYICLLLVVAFAMTTTACKSSNAAQGKSSISSKKAQKFHKLIVGVWYVNVDKLEFPAEVMADASPEQISEMKEMMKKISFDFKADGTCSFSAPGDEAKKGKWKVSDDGKTLTMTDEVGTDDASVIETLSATEFVIVSNGMKIPLKH